MFGDETWDAVKVTMYAALSHCPKSMNAVDFESAVVKQLDHATGWGERYCRQAFQVVFDACISDGKLFVSQGVGLIDDVDMVALYKQHAGFVGKDAVAFGHEAQDLVVLDPYDPETRERVPPTTTKPGNRPDGPGSLMPLDEWNKRRTALREKNADLPYDEFNAGNGIACPSCGSELTDMGGQLFTDRTVVKCKCMCMNMKCAKVSHRIA